MVTSSTQSDLRNFLFRNNPVAMFLYDGATLRILGANDAAIKTYGYTCRELRTMTVRNLRPYGQTPALEDALLLDHESPSRSLWTHATKAGKSFPVEVSVTQYLRRKGSLFLMAVIDASAWSNARMRLVRSEEIHRSLVEECPFGIYRFNLTTGKMEQANPVLRHASGYTLEEICSSDVSLLYGSSEDRDRYLAELLSNGYIRDFETRLLRKDGGVNMVSLSGYLYTDAETGHQLIRGYVLDITRQREVEEQLTHSNRMEAVGRLAGGVAHDFNNITQSISLSCELALQHTLPPTIESKLVDIMQQASRAAEITRQLLAFSRRQVLQPRVININACIRNSLSMVSRAVGVDVTVDLRLDETVDNILVDPEQLALVLMHLADNARGAMPDGGRFCISTSSSPAIDDPIRRIRTDACAVLTVSDTGVGMNEATLMRIFEPFFSTKNTTVTTGLGLSTVHGIISQSKGRIECDSTLGQGTTFRIYLPFAGESPRGTSVGNIAKKNEIRILLAEDDPIVNKHLTMALRQAGFTVDPASNGEEALSTYKKHSYDFLITDIMMPKLSGIELTRRIRHQHPNIPVVLISGYSEEVTVLQDLPKNSIDYLQKPFSTQQLVTVIRKLLSNSQEMEQAVYAEPRATD